MHTRTHARKIIIGRPPRLSHSSLALLSLSLCLLLLLLLLFTSTETIRTIWDGEPRTATSAFTQLLNSALFFFFFRCCLTTTETIGPSVLGTGAQDGHLGFHTAPELCSLLLLLQMLPYDHRDHRTISIRDGSPGRPPRLSHSS